MDDFFLKRQICKSGGHILFILIPPAPAPVHNKYFVNDMTNMIFEEWFTFSVFIRYIPVIYLIVHAVHVF